MLRAAWLSAVNDARLLVKDPVVLLMLLAAPVVIITVAGYSLGGVYGRSTSAHVLPIVDEDGDELASRIVASLEAETSLRVERVADVATARRLVDRPDGPPLAIAIPAGTSAAMREGGSPRLVLYVDPTKRIEADALELRLGELVHRASEEAKAAAQARADEAQADLRRELDRLTQALRAERDRIEASLDDVRARARETVRTQVAAAIGDARRRIEAQIRTREDQAIGDIERQLEPRRVAVERLRAKLEELRTAEAAFRDWLAKLQAIAGRHASDLPPPPTFPTLPSDAELAELTRPIAPPAREKTAALPSVDVPSITIPTLALPDESPALDTARDVRFGRLPGILGIVEEPANPREDVTVNAFDQYVPGFGVTFLLIGMMLGIALTLVDERSWGTLQRLEASGAPLTGLLLGKVASRFAVGVVQMVLLFAVGRALFGISLGAQPAALLLPTVAMSFAAASLGLVMPTLTDSHDAVMPLGTMVSMAISAVGGCWWPLDFEPSWMRSISGALPTTWVMQAYNDLMIRRADWSAAVWPSAAAFGIGVLYLAVGVIGNVGVSGVRRRIGAFVPARGDAR